MKKVILIILMFFIGLISYSQSTDGYYYGMVNDSLQNKYIFMSFVSTDGDDEVYIVPYIQDSTNKDTSFMHKNFTESLKKQQNDSIDGYIYLDNGWSIAGFDNYSYYTVDGYHISFSLNISTVDNEILDMFEFNGKFSDDGNQIKAVVSSTDTIFNLSLVILTYKKLEK